MLSMHNLVILSSITLGRRREHSNLNHWPLKYYWHIHIKFLIFPIFQHQVCCFFMSYGYLIYVLYVAWVGTPWTEEEHRMFLLGLQKLGKGDWRGISRNFVVSRTPTQVASHAQKYFIRKSNMTRRKRRSSLFDMVPDEVTPSYLFFAHKYFIACSHSI